jgi:hypothetical protein
MQMLCEAYDMDYEEIKGKIPDPEDDNADPFKAQTALDAVVVEDPDGGGVIE